MKKRLFLIAPFALLLALVLLFFARGLEAAPARDTTAQQENAISLTLFWALVEDTRLAMAQLETPPANLQAGELHRLAQRWQDIRAVTLPDGRAFPISTSRLVSRLTADSPATDAIEAELNALLAARENWPDRPPLPSDARAQLDRILAGPEYQWASGGEPNAIIRFIRTAILRFYLLVLSLTNFTSRGISAVVGALIFLIVLVFGLRGLWSTLVGEAALVTDHHLDEPISAAVALERAREFSLSGDYRTAVRYLYLSTLLELEERGLLIYDRSRTNREYLRSVADRPELAATLRDVVDVFDRVWYGFQPLAEDAYLQYQAQVEALRRRRGPV